MAECPMCGGSGGWPGAGGWVTCKPCNGSGQVVHKKLWIDQVIRADLVTAGRVIRADLVTPMRRFGDAANKEPVVTCINVPVVGAAPSGDNPGGLPPIRLAPTTLRGFFDILNNQQPALAARGNQ